MSYSEEWVLRIWWRHRLVESVINVSAISVCQDFTKSELVLCGLLSGGRNPNVIRIGMATPSPTIIASRLASAVTVSKSDFAPSGKMFSTNLWSASFPIRRTHNVPHWLRTLWESSEGRCETSPKDSPYLRPSLATRDMARVVAVKLSAVSDGM